LEGYLREKMAQFGIFGGYSSVRAGSGDVRQQTFRGQ
jgi:hypothetical protein